MGGGTQGCLRHAGADVTVSELTYSGAAIIASQYADVSVHALTTHLTAQLDCSTMLPCPVTMSVCRELCSAGRPAHRHMCCQPCLWRAWSALLQVRVVDHIPGQ